MITPNFLELATVDEYEQGQKVFTLGFPVVGVLGPEPKYTEGTISPLTGIQSEDSLIQMSVPIQPGNSGGPLVNENGKVVGLITSTAAIAEFFRITGTLPQNVNWAVKSSYITLLLGKTFYPEKDIENVIERTKKCVFLIKATN